MSNQFIGRDIEVGVALGDAESADHSIQKSTANIFKNVETAEDETTRGSIISGKGRRVTQKYAEGNISGNVHSEAIGYLLRNVWGASESTSEGDSVYSHEFTLDDDHIHDELTFFLKEGTEEKEIEGAHINSLEISASPDSYVTFTAEIIGEDLVDGSFIPSYSTEYDFIGKDVTIVVADTKGELETEEATEVKEVTINQNRNLNRYHILGSYTPKKIYGPRFDNEITITKEYLNDTFKDLHEGDDSKYLRITIEGDEAIGGTNNAKLEYDFYNVQVTDWSKNDGADDLIEETFTLKAYENTSEATDKLGKATLQNLTEDYDLSS
jgi:hypothetical protein